MNSGVYEIRHERGAAYVGSAANFIKRWNEHRRDLNSGVHHSRYLQRAWAKHGERAFEFRKLLVCSKENLLMYEQMAIDALMPRYNVCKVAGNLLGFRHSDETRAKKSAAMIGNTFSRGVKHTPESCANMSASKIGNKFSLGFKHSGETIARRSAAMIGNTFAIGNKNALGCKRSPESRAKMSASGKVKVFTAQHRANMSAAQRARQAKRKRAQPPPA